MSRGFCNKENPFAHVVAQWDYYRTLRGIPTERLYKAMGISESLYYHYRKHPEEIRLSHYDASCKCLKIPVEDRRLYI